jgi:glycosyltransferase involved in cell wall biosynthesis
MGGLMVSIVINNYNYAQFLGSAIESALNQDYESCQVIVVDDGSRDASFKVIESYSDRVLPLLQENKGQSSALNTGFAASQGDIVIFLDADDLLEPSAVRRVVEAFQKQPELARVQYRLGVIDSSGETTGETKPSGHVPVPSGDIRRQVLQFPFDVSWLPTSGNAFAARVLRRIMPIPEQYGRINADYYLVHTAPLFGPVLFLDQVLAYYRVHGENNFERAEGSLDLERLRSTIHYDELSFQWIRRRAREAGLEQQFGVPVRNHSVSTAASRLASLKLEPQEHPLQGDRLLPLIILGMRSALRRFDTSMSARLVFCAWFLIMGLAPRRLARWWADLFFFPERRKAFSSLLGRLHKQHASKRRRASRKVESSPGKPAPTKQAEGEEG